MSEYNLTDRPRFRSLDGRIRSASPEAARPQLTTTTARKLLNALYLALAKHDAKAAEQVCQQHDA